MPPNVSNRFWIITVKQLLTVFFVVCVVVVSIAAAFADQFFLSIVVFLLVLVFLLGSITALAFRTWRRKAKWAALASAVGLVVSFAFLLLANNKDEQQAHEMGFLSATDRRLEERRAAEQKRADDRRAAEQAKADAARLAVEAKADAARLAVEEKLAEERRCEQDLRCTAEKALSIATMRCTSAVERLAKNNFEWIDKWDERKFSRYRRPNNNTSIVTYIGDKIKYQNGFGAWILSVYECDFDTKGERVTDARAQAGRLPE